MGEADLVDSHCHLDFQELASDLPAILARMQDAGVGSALIAGVTLERFPAIHALTCAHPQLFAAVGVHPDTPAPDEPGGAREATVDELIALGQAPQVVAIGETGLDYFRLDPDPIRAQAQKKRQQSRLRVHIEAALQINKPLIIHCRSAADDVLAILKQTQAGRVGGVFHCFTEDESTAQQALALGFYISFSGILTFKNAQALRQCAQTLPLERLLVETDSPYLSPAPWRGARNEPARVRRIAEELAALRGIPVDTVARETTANFYRLFSCAEAISTTQDHEK
jgi:TatD DNase family protein